MKSWNNIAELSFIPTVQVDSTIYVDNKHISTTLLLYTIILYPCKSWNLFPKLALLLAAYMYQQQHFITCFCFNCNFQRLDKLWAINKSEYILEA